jgi:hypothetical protein
MNIFSDFECNYTGGWIADTEGNSREVMGTLGRGNNLCYFGAII